MGGSGGKKPVTTLTSKSAAARVEVSGAARSNQEFEVSGEGEEGAEEKSGRRERK